MSIRNLVSGLLFLGLFAAPASSQQSPGRVSLPGLANGAVVSFVRSASGEWGIEISGAGIATLSQQKPARVELYRKSGEVRQRASGYQSVSNSAGGASAQAEIADGAGARFRVNDVWSVAGSVLSLRRTVEVVGGEDGAGFYSAIMFATAPNVTWPDLDFLAPGLLYGDPAYDGLSSPGGMTNYRARRFLIREDLLPAPLFGVSFRNGRSVTVLDLAPRGHTTQVESRAPAEPAMIDGRFQFAALGASEIADGGVEVGFWLPGTVIENTGRRGEQPVRAWRRRYHPVRQGFTQDYQVGFRFGESESFPELTRNSWRWAWQTLKPAVNWTDVEVVRRSLIDQLSSQVMTVDGRTGLPFFVSTVTGKIWADPPPVPPATTTIAPSTRAVMGFVGKNIESADQLLREGDRDTGPRGQRMRQQGLAIIETFIRLVPMSPPAGSGFDLMTGRPMWNEPRSNQWYLRGPVEDMRTLLQAYDRERKLGREHPDWLRWAQQLGDWLLPQQREDGSFPRSFKPGTSEVVETSGTTSYNPVPMLVLLTDITGEPEYRQAAVRAAEYVWQSFGTRGVFIGGAIDNPNITDKEAGMLALEAFMTLYEATQEAKWLKRARIAGDFAESWTWIWNVPMPEDASDAELHWKKNVSTVGAQGITAQVAGHVDQYLDWAVATYVKLYKYTKDQHYLDFARILLHNAKAMTALPGRLYGMLDPGWQQENWRFGPAREGRGFGTPEKWMPWVTSNHLYGITMLEETDPVIFRQLSTKPVEAGQ